MPKRLAKYNFIYFFKMKMKNKLKQTNSNKISVEARHIETISNEALYCRFKRSLTL